MKKEDLKNKPTNELESRLKATKTVMGMHIGVLTVLAVVIFYGLATNENKATFSALIVVVLSCSGIIPLQLSTIKKIKEELEKRKKEQ